MAQKLGQPESLDVLFRDALVLIVNKPAGIAVHAGTGPGAHLGPLLAGLRFGLPNPPELAHRLDRDTAGCLVLGRHRQALKRLGTLFAQGRVDKVYCAVVEGGPVDDDGHIDMPLARLVRDGRGRTGPSPDGKPAQTEWRVLGRGGGRCWLACRPLTGRTHQIRAHLAESGWPIVGDPVYGRAGGGLHLFAQSVSIPLYGDKKPPVAATAPVPPHMVEVLTTLGL